MSPDIADHHKASQADTRPEPVGEDHQEQAARLGRDNPQWLVVWGSFSHEFVAFPRFRVPAGTVLHSRSVPELVRRMRQAEQIYGGSRDD
jgi:hypothetical protein